MTDAKGNVVGETETSTRGRYALTVPAGPASGYSVKVVHGDYTGKFIDNGAATGSLREASPEDRKILVRAARNKAWVGSTKKPSRHDLALIPSHSDDE